ncbi:phage baseplate assembly protein V [Chitinimonas koreensis]|uniref:phage baseplate assembly protein V n=1 Tax=Chitinimonas koreensis TaxID=356302 RepID=UPI00048D76BE|nr:phage baseplate assembly protein V [Chitinimonas koreensis]QNM96389.1 phage baseplate assembly protein V [Chitinimonas koreensis]
MNANAETNRRLESVLRDGTVFAVDHETARCRVKSGGLESEWLPWLAARAGTTTTWDPPTIGEQVLVFAASGEGATGLVLMGIYSDQIPPPDRSPHTHVRAYPDGARIAYDHQLSALTVTGIKTALVDASDSITATAGKSITAEAGETVMVKAGVSVTIDAPDTHVTGNLTVDKLLTYLGGMAGFGTPGSAGGNVATIHGTVQTVGGDLIADEISVKQHVHIEQGDSQPTSPARSA